MADRGCESCHGPGSFHVSRAHGGKGFPPMIYFGDVEHAAPRDVQLKICLDCHTEDIGNAFATPFIGSSHDAGGITCSNCHVSHASVDPILDDKAAQTANCVTCHETILSDHQLVRRRTVEESPMTCGACHDLHEPLPD